MMHLRIEGGLGDHWIRSWPGFCSAHIHCPNQYWLVYWQGPLRTNTNDNQSIWNTFSRKNSAELRHFVQELVYVFRIYPNVRLDISIPKWHFSGIGLAVSGWSPTYYPVLLSEIKWHSGMDHIRYFPSDVITHPWPNFLRSAKPPLKLWHGWIIASNFYVDIITYSFPNLMLLELISFSKKSSWEPLIIACRLPKREIYWMSHLMTRPIP